MAIGIWQLVLILALVLIIFGGRRLPELGRGLGLGLSNFRNAIQGDKSADKVTPANESDRQAEDVGSVNT